MAAKPTGMQEQACDRLAESLLLITEAARPDGKGDFDRDDPGEIARRLARASSAFRLDEIVAGALERRGRAPGLPGSTAELLTRMEAEITPLEMLLPADDPSRERIGKREEELGEVRGGGVGLSARRCPPCGPGSRPRST